MIKITINKAYRNFKEGDVFELRTSEKPLFIVAENGSGKTSLLSGIRGIKDSLKNINKKIFDGMSSVQQKVAASEFKACTTVEGLEGFDEVFCCDRISDDPTSMELAATCTGFITGGGYRAQRLSGGQKSIMMLSNFIAKISKVHEKDKKALIIFDEMDTGLSMTMQQRYVDKTKKILEKYGIENASLIFVTHNPLTILGAKECTIYELDLKAYYDDPKEWFEDTTGYELERN